jgi:hypothetical protein
MHSRVTQLEIDTVRVSVEEAVDLFRREVLPALREQQGFQGVLVLATPEGRGMLVSFWDTETAADASADSGFYPETLARYVTIFRSPPGRERYAVALAELPALAVE